MRRTDENLEMDMARFLVLGLDLSLTGTGYAGLSDGHVEGGTFRPAGSTDLDRIRSVKDFLTGLAYTDQPNLICVEGLAYASTVGRSSTRAGMWWVVVEALDYLGYAVISCEPTRLKKFATGKGTASKDQMMLATARAFPDFDGDNNQADAYWLAVFGAHVVGQSVPVTTTSYRDKAVEGYSVGGAGL